MIKIVNESNNVLKYELTEETIKISGKTLYQIRALKNFTLSTGIEVHLGDLGGFVESENNLSQDGDAWVLGDAKVFGNAWVRDDVEVSGDTEITD